MGESTYQGWANYPTWAVALWIDNEEWYYDQTVEMAASNLVKYEEDATYWMADELKDWVEENKESAWRDYLPPNSYGMMSDLLGWAIEQVNWRELAIHYLEVAREQASDE